MKNSSIKKILFIICTSFICSHTFAQGPADPGNDPVLSSNEISKNIHVPLKKTEYKNNNLQANFWGNISVAGKQKTLITKIYFSDYSVKYSGSKTKISFSNGEENERKPNFILPFGSVYLHQI